MNQSEKDLSLDTDLISKKKSGKSSSASHSINSVCNHEKPIEFLDKKAEDKKIVKKTLPATTKSVRKKTPSSRATANGLLMDLPTESVQYAKREDDCVGDDRRRVAEPTDGMNAEKEEGRKNIFRVDDGVMVVRPQVDVDEYANREEVESEQKTNPAFVMHLAKRDRETLSVNKLSTNSNTEDLKRGNNYCMYLPVVLNSVPCNAMIDSGNVWRNVISESFAKKLGLQKKDLKPLGTVSVGTAKAGAELSVLGQVRRPLELRLGGLPKKFKIQPAVIRGLSMPLNLSGPFMKAQGIDQLHSKNCIRVMGRLLPLSRMPNPPRSEISTVSPVYIAKRTTIQPAQQAWIRARLPEVERGRMPAGDCLIKGSSNSK